MLTVEPPAVPADHWAATAQSLARTLAERYKDRNIDNWADALQWATRAVDRTTDMADDQLRAGNFLIYGRAAIAYGVPMLLSHPADDAGKYLTWIKNGAGTLDRLGVTGGAPLAPAADELAAAVAAASSATWPGAAVPLAGLRLLAGIQDRRGQIELHAQFAMRSADLTDRQRHLAEAERLLSVSDDDYLQLLVEAVRMAVEKPG